jgi:hypothetical protein
MRSGFVQRGGFWVVGQSVLLCSGIGGGFLASGQWLRPGHGASRFSRRNRTVGNTKLMKATAVVIVLLAVVVGVVPQFTDCQFQGRAIELPNGKSLPMKCHWTARAAIGLAIPLLLCGAGMLFSHRKETWRQLARMAIVLGLMVVLLPTVLIGVCAKPDMVCHAVMRPVLTLTGSLVAAVGGVGFLLASRAKDSGQ